MLKALIVLIIDISLVRRKHLLKCQVSNLFDGVNYSPQETTKLRSCKTVWWCFVFPQVKIKVLLYYASFVRGLYNRKPFRSVLVMNWHYVSTNKNTGIDVFWKFQVCLTVFYLFLVRMLRVLKKLYQLSRMSNQYRCWFVVRKQKKLALFPWT